MKTLIIAEIGVNHNGNLELAKKLIKTAKKCGADIAKFQFYNTDELIDKKAPKANYQVSKKLENQYQMLKNLEFDYSKQKIISDYCKKNDIEYCCSIFDLSSCKYIPNLNLKRIKIPSGEINNIPLLKKIGSFNKKIILSTGMSNYSEILKAINLITKSGTKKNKITILYCSSAYPAEIKNLNFNMINFLSKKFSTNVGFSDHTMECETPIVAVALGATVIEKHFTLNKKLKGPDHFFSLNPQEFTQMSNLIRKTEKSIIKKNFKIHKDEKKNIFFVRKSLVANKDIKIGEKFSITNLTSKRPLSGVSVGNWSKYITKKSKKNFKKGDFIL